MKSFMLREVDNPNCYLQTKVNLNNSVHSGGLIVRYTDASNHYRLDVTLSGGTYRVSIIDVFAGTPTAIGSAIDTGISAGTDAVFRMEAFTRPGSSRVNLKSWYTTTIVNPDGLDFTAAHDIFDDTGHIAAGSAGYFKST